MPCYFSGDDLYPENPDFEGEHPIMSISCTVEEAKIKYPNHNRSEVIPQKGKAMSNSSCNVKMADGQVIPVFALDFMEHKSLL